METYEKETESLLRKSFVVNIVPVNITMERSDDEYLTFYIEMSNGDKIEYDSYKTISPKPEDAQRNKTKMFINYGEVEMTSSEIEDGIDGALNTYKRIKNMN